MSQNDNDTRHMILNAADVLFSERGYASVRLKDIADVIGVKHAALYYYFPGCKEELYTAVMQYIFQRHRAGMTESIAQANADVRDQLWAVADWLLAHAPVNVGQIERSDFAAIAPEHAQALSTMIYDSLRQPLREALAAAQTRGEIGPIDVDLAAVSFITLVESVHGTINPYLIPRKREAIDGIINLLLYGWLPR